MVLRHLPGHAANEVVVAVAFGVEGLCGGGADAPFIVSGEYWYHFHVLIDVVSLAPGCHQLACCEWLEGKPDPAGCDTYPLNRLSLRSMAR
jgi:hypothetical protein